MRALILFVSLIATTSTFAAPVPCKPGKWPFSRLFSLPTLTAKLQHIPRNDLIQMAWGEMTFAEPSDSMALPILQYLYSTEDDKAMQGYYEVLELDLTANYDPQTVLAIWPKRAPILKRSTLALPELCQLFEAARSKK